MTLSRFLATTSTGSPRAWDVGFAYYDPPEAALALNLSSATATIAGLYSVAGQESTPRGVYFSPDGLRMYVVGSTGDDVNQYALSVPFTPSNKTFVQSFLVSAQDTNPYGVFFRPDGTAMYVLGGSTDVVYQYALSTPWDVSTSVLSQSFSVSAQETSPTGFWFKPDGTAMYVIGSAGDDVNQYSLSPAWSVSTATFVQSSANAGDTSPVGLAFSPDGDRMYVNGQGTDAIDMFNLSTPWDVSTISAAGAISNGVTAAWGLYASPDGGKLYFCDYALDTVLLVSLGVFSISSQETSPAGISFKPDGLRMYITGATGDDINEYHLTTAWDTSTASFVQNKSISSLGETGVTGHYFKTDGTSLFFVGTSLDAVQEWALSTPWDVSTASFDQSFSVAGQESQPRGVHFSPDGSNMYVVGTAGDGVDQYELTTPWELSTASFVAFNALSVDVLSSYSIFFRPDGLRMFVVDGTTGIVAQYELTTAWSVATASYSKRFDLGDSTPSGIFFRDDGLKMFLVGSSGDAVYSYSLGPLPYSY